MFDGNWWNGGCAAPDHGHPVPYRPEDHIRTSLDLAQRVQRGIPHVLIEMHDMLAGGSPRDDSRLLQVRPARQLRRELGVRADVAPMADLSGRAPAPYYYNLGCNVPVYLHIDLTQG